MLIEERCDAAALVFSRFETAYAIFAACLTLLSPILLSFYLRPLYKLVAFFSFGATTQRGLRPPLS